MPQASKTFRIFVSSTFTDFKEEREALQRYVFPGLRELCLKHGCRFQAIDLRWGVSEQAALDQQTVSICLKEVTMCQEISPRPNFIILLGDRYGWCPLPHQIPAEEFKGILSKISHTEDKKLLTHWYWCDYNAVPAAYCLQPRSGKYEDSAVWALDEHRLHFLLLEAIRELPLGDNDRQKYITSATEQEIELGALGVQDATEHVFCFFRSIQVPKKKGETCREHQENEKKRCVPRSKPSRFCRS